MKFAAGACALIGALLFTICLFSGDWKTLEASFKIQEGKAECAYGLRHLRCHFNIKKGELQDSPGIHLAYADLSRWLAFFGAKNKEIPSDVVGPLKKYRAHFKALNIWGLVTAILCFCTILLAFAFGVLLLLRDQFNPEHAKLILSAIWWTSLMICALLALMATIFVILAAPPDLPKPISQMMKTSLSIGWAYILFWFGVLSTVGAGLLARLLLGRMTAAPTAPHAAPPATVPYAS